MTPRFHVQTPFAQAIFALLEKVADLAGSNLDPMKVYIAGGVATHLYTGSRVSHDLDAEFSKRFLVDGQLTVRYDDPAQGARTVMLDTSYNSTFALMHEDYVEDAVPMASGWNNPKLQLFLLSPVDLVVSKIARLSDNDKVDIVSLARAGLVTAEAVEMRADQASEYYVGNKSFLIHNLHDALGLINGVSREHAQAAIRSHNGNEPSP